jgi:hypothetical protein
MQRRISPGILLIPSVATAFAIPVLAFRDFYAAFLAGRVALPRQAGAYGRAAGRA